MQKKRIKVVITGAAGQIGYALLFRLASGQMFGPDVELDLHLLELEAALPALNGLAMELQDGAFPLLKNIVCTADLKTAMSDVHWAVLIGSMPRKQGMERSDLLKINGGIFKAQGEALNKYAAKDVRIFVVGNPCNTNALIAMNHAPDIPNDRFFAMTSLDELRAKGQLAEKAGVGVEEVSQMTIWGNHSGTQYPDFYHAKIAGQAVVDRIDKNWLENQFIPIVQQRGAAVIKARGASSAASAANAAITGVHHLTHPTPEGESYSMVRCSQGEYGVDKGLMFSFPCYTDSTGQIKVVENIEHNTFGQEKFIKTLEELRAEKQSVQDLGLI